MNKERVIKLEIDAMPDIEIYREKDSNGSTKQIYVEKVRFRSVNDISVTYSPKVRENITELNDNYNLYLTENVVRKAYLSELQDMVPILEKIQEEIILNKGKTLVLSMVVNVFKKDDKEYLYLTNETAKEIKIV